MASYMREGNAVMAPSMATPVILSVTLHEAINLTVREDLRELQNDKKHDPRRWDRDSIWCGRCNLPYAIIIYEKSESYLKYTGGTTEHPLWPGKRRYNTCDFDASSAGELLIYLYLRDPNPNIRQPDVCLGFARARPFDANNEANSDWLQIEQGAGSIRVSFEFKAARVEELEESDFTGMEAVGASFSGSVGQVKKKDTGRIYMEKFIALTEDVLQLQCSISQRLPEIRHPFIAPILSTYLSDVALHILSPHVSGGHLLHLVQIERHLSVDSCRFYIAEIICALEYLHSTHKIFCWMKPRNVLLDATGHVILCGFRPSIPNANVGHYDIHLATENSEPGRFLGFIHVEKDVLTEHYSILGTTEYPAPELLLTDEGESEAGDWWTLGILLYEMLTGLPPFYDQDPDCIRENILNSKVLFPESMPSSARDLVSRLLERSPKTRLGTSGGAAEIKNHPFFSNIDWHRVPLRLYTPTFKPRPACRALNQHGVEIGLYLPRRHALSYSVSYSPELRLDGHLSPSGARHPTIVVDHDWELLWEDAQFNFQNRVTNVKQRVPAGATLVAIPKDDGRDEETGRHSLMMDKDWKRLYDDGQFEYYKRATNDQQTVSLGETRVVVPSDRGGDGAGTPSMGQILDALEAALLAGYFSAVMQLLGYGIDLRLKLFGNQKQTPLQWAVENGTLDLVQLFLDHGAPVSCHPQEISLVTAVKNGSSSVIKVFLPETDRKSSTIALGVAVSRRNVATAKQLLESGVQCDFEDGDRPLPHNAEYSDYIFYSRDISEPDNFRAPLIYAILLGDVDLVRLLLSYGANPNVSRHDDTFQRGCGKAVELAMGLGHTEIVHLLLDYGADIYLAYEAWDVPGHICNPFPRPLYQKISAGLREILATRETSVTLIGSNAEAPIFS